MECVPSVNGQTNVVSNVHWIVNATDGTYNSTVYGTQPLIYSLKTPFTDYSNLTETTVIEWIQIAMGDKQIAAIQNNLDNQIAILANPPVIVLPLPWST